MMDIKPFVDTSSSVQSDGKLEFLRDDSFDQLPRIVWDGGGERCRAGMMSTENITTSAIVCTKDRPSDLKRFLDSLSIQTLLPDELLVIDASRSRQTQSMVRKLCNSMRVPVRCVTTLPGLTRQRNIGVSQSIGELLFFFDDDVILDRSFFKIIIETYSTIGDDSFGGMMGRIAGPESQGRTVRRTVDSIFKKVFLLSDVSSGRLKHSGFPSHCSDRRLSRVGVMPGGLTVYHRRVFGDELFDEALTGYAYMEDVDFSSRAAKRFSLWYQPLAIVEHFPSTYRSADTRLLRKMMVQNHSYLFRKNFPKTFSGILAHTWSIVGVIFYNMMVARDWRGAFGAIEGFLYGTIFRQGPGEKPLK